MPTVDTCLVILPTYNESRNIRTLIQDLVSEHPGVHVLVVDDSSPDGTADIVREIARHEPRVDLIVRKAKLGLGTAYLAGFLWARDRAFRAVCTMDSDNSHDPALLSSLLHQLENADLVIGSRYVSGGKNRSSPARKFVSSVANTIARFRLGSEVRDCTSGYRAYSASLAHALSERDYRSQGFSMLVELLGEAMHRNARIVELPIVFTDRHSGKSKLGVREILESLRVYGGLNRRGTKEAQTNGKMRKQK